mmetsp:Transcript_820/g.2217  ORF Transcript_820/g.2217 Transcript_820/m.2217 type:complete len:135 (-) Transcript_820:77-481(-)
MWVQLCRKAGRPDCGQAPPFGLPPACSVSRQSVSFLVLDTVGCRVLGRGESAGGGAHGKGCPEQGAPQQGAPRSARSLRRACKACEEGRKMHGACLVHQGVFCHRRRSCCSVRFERFAVLYRGRVLLVRAPGAH